MERSSPRCRIISFITSNAGDDVNGSVFEIQLHTSRYTISILFRRQNFRTRPSGPTNFKSIWHFSALSTTPTVTHFEEMGEEHAEGPNFTTLHRLLRLDSYPRQLMP
jgi:hypothetical protein